MPLGAARFGLGGVTDLGKLELIETQTFTSGSTVDFLTLNENTYNVHFVTFNNVQFSTDAFLLARVSDDNGSTFEASNYQYAYQYGNTAPAFGEGKSTTATSFTNLSGNGGATNESHNGYVYFYNLGDSAKYSFVTNHSSQMNSLGQFLFYFGSQVYTVSSTINALRFLTSTGTFESGSISLYGIAES